MQLNFACKYFKHSRQCIQAKKQSINDCLNVNNDKNRQKMAQRRDNSKTLFNQNRINLICINSASFANQINQKVPLHYMQPFNCHSIRLACFEFLFDKTGIHTTYHYANVLHKLLIGHLLFIGQKYNG